MKFINKLQLLIKRHQTRQQLRHLPEHLLQDIGKSQQEIIRELQKNSIFTFISHILGRFIRRG